MHNDGIEGQIVLEISNTFDEGLNIGENGLPISKERGHGIGMLSLLSFAKKYDAYFDFSQENGYVKVAMYWKD
ncbi:MAG: GHKL domain-containing protein [Selenomonadaceae bacterium]|nr:GHKL domain-containing protein [Selenomonadaceae bacterium]